MTLSANFSEQTLIDAIQAGDFVFLTRSDISVKTAQTLIDKYYKPPIDEVVQEALDAGLIEDEDVERFKEKVQDADGDDIDFSRSFLRHSYNDYVDESAYSDGMMVIKEDRVSATLYFTFGAGDDGVFLGWADNKKRDQRAHYDSFTNMFDGKYLTADPSGRIYLKAAKPVLAARSVTVDARWVPGEENQKEAIESAIEKGRQLTSLGLRDPESRSEDPYISGRHYSSMHLLVNRKSHIAVPTTKDGQVEKRVLGGGEIEVKPHNLNNLDFDETMRVILSKRGHISNDGSIFEQIGSHISREIADTARSDPQAAAELTALATKMALK
jgi:hypothetical protein